MKLKRIKKYKSCLIVLGIALMISNVQGVVFCEAEDGHASIELVSSACCGSLNTNTSSDESPPQKTEAFSSSKDGCGPCVDTPISAEAIGDFEKTDPVNATAVVLPAIVTVSVESCNFSKYQLDSKLFAPLSPYLASLRTIVLLT